VGVEVIPPSIITLGTRRKLLVSLTLFTYGTNSLICWLGTRACLDTEEEWKIFRSYQ